MASRKPLGLYFHIPFCRQKCVYCDFYSLPDSESRMDASERSWSLRTGIPWIRSISAAALPAISAPRD